VADEPNMDKHTVNGGVGVRCIYEARLKTP